MAHDVRLHDLLHRILKHLPGDYKPWGEVAKDDPGAPGGWWSDCSSGCRHYLALADVGDQPISNDWGVCINPKSHRYGLLTFEHQGCPAFDCDDEAGAKLAADLEMHRAEYLKGREGQGEATEEREGSLTSRGGDPSGWKAWEELAGCIKDGPRFWGEVTGEVEAHVTAHGTIVLSKEYRRRGRKLGLPWLEMTADELRGVLAKGEELLRAIEAEKKREAD